MHVKRGCSICARLTKVCHRIRHAIRHHHNTLCFKCISYHVTDVTDVTVYFLFYMRIAYYPRDCTNSITMLLKELQGCKVNSAIILLVGARFARPKIVYVAYYSQDRDRWFGQASPTTVKLRKNIYRKAYPNASPSSSNEYLPDCNSSSLAYLEGSPLSFLYKIINRLSFTFMLIISSFQSTISLYIS